MKSNKFARKLTQEKTKKKSTYTTRSAFGAKSLDCVYAYIIILCL